MEPNYYADIGKFEKELTQSTANDTDEQTLYGPWLDKKMKSKNYSDFPPASLQ